MQAIRLLCLNFGVDDWLESAETAEVDSESACFSGEAMAKKYEWKSFHHVSLEYSQVQGEREVTKEEFLAYHAEHPNLARDYEQGRREAIGKLAELSRQASAILNEGSELADLYAISWIVETDHGDINVQRLNAVDWDSSSMYC